MMEQHILYFSLCRQHVEGFKSWATGRAPGKIIDWLKEIDSDPTLPDLPSVIGRHRDKDHLCVIVDYLSFVKGVNKDKYQENAAIVRRTIIQFPEVDFLFDQSGVPDTWLSGVEFLLEDTKEDTEGGDINKVVQGFHIFRKDDGFVLSKMDYDNILDGSNLRWAVKRKYYKDLNLVANEGNFKNLQNTRAKSLAIVIDDEPRQSRFNGYVLYASGYRVISVNTARMLLLLNDCVEKGKLVKPQIIVRDFDLQFPDVRKKGENKDYDEEKNIYNHVYRWDNNWKLEKDNGDLPNLTVDTKPFVGQKKDGGKIDSNMIDAIRNYRFFKEIDCAESRWKVPQADKQDNQVTKENPFWSETLIHDVPIFVVTNGHDMMRIIHSKYTEWYVKDDRYLNVHGIEKPISGLYYPFFTKLKDKEGNNLVKENFKKTRYGIVDGEKYAINKKRKDHNHGVSVDVYDTATEMIHRAEKYYEVKRYIKAAVLAQETIELLNGFHYQMMIKAYQIKTKAENAIAMDVVGADEHQLVLDAVERIKIIKEDVRRMVYPLNKGEKHGWFADIVIQYHRRKKEHEILGHIFSDCRVTCRDNEFFEAEAVFIREMAHIDQRALGIEDLRRYYAHRKFMKSTQ